MKIYRFFIPVIALIFIAPLSQAQYIEQVEEITAGNFFGYGARQMAMGGAGMMAVDGAALFYNPANLARIPRIEFNLGLSYQKYEDKSTVRTIRREVDYSSTIPQSEIHSPRFSGFVPQAGTSENSKTNTRLNSAILTIPYPTYRGSLVFGLGVVRTANFDRAFKLYHYDLSGAGSIVAVGEEFQSGGLIQWGAGFGLDISPRVSFGGALYLYTGKHEYDWEYSLDSLDYTYSTESLIEDKYLGWNAKMSLAMRLSPVVSLGFGIETPINLNVEEEYFGGVYDYVEYDVKRPFVLSSGAALNLNYFELVADIDYTDWSQMTYGDNPDMEAYNNDIKTYYRDVIRFRLGGEYVIADWGLSLRAGYFNDPLPIKKQFINDNRWGYSLGLGFLIDEVMTVDLAFVHGTYNRNSDFIYAAEYDTNDEILNSHNLIVDEDITYNRLYITTAYRF